MAEAALGVPPPTSLYPQPPQQQGALSGNPTQMLDLIGAITRNQMLQNELKSRTAIGQAYSGALNPDGSFDPNRLAAGLKNPDAAWGLQDATTHLLQQQGTQFDLSVKKNQFLSDGIGALADKPNLSKEDVYNFAATAARVMDPTGQNVPAMLTGWMNTVLAGNPGPKELRNRLQTARSLAIGSSGLASRVAAPPTATGAQAQQSTGQSIFGGAQPIGQPPGEETLQGASAQAAAAMEATAGTTSQYHADLENLRQLNKDIPLTGPTAEWEKKLNQVGSRLGIGVTMTRDQLAKAEEFDKIANNVSLNQSRLFHGSDAGLHTVIAANPNLGMSRYGREGVIDMLQGNQDAVDRVRKMWLDARARGAPANTYNQFVNKASQTVDPRVFQFNRMSRENQQKFLSDMDPSDLPDFEAKIVNAADKKWIKPSRELQKAIDGMKAEQKKGNKSSSLGTPPTPGARQGRDASGNPGWFVADADRPGKYLQYMTG